MRNFFALAAFSAPDAVSGASSDISTTVTPVADATPVKPVRKPRAAKPATGDAKPVKPLRAKRDAAPEPTPAEPAAEPRVAPIARTCATIAANATNFGGVLSDRDAAYIAFYAGFAKRASDGIVTIRAIADAGTRPNYAGSSKPHDAGIVNRLRKANVVTVESDGTSFRFTDHGRSLKPYAAA